MSTATIEKLSKIDAAMRSVEESERTTDHKAFLFSCLMAEQDKLLGISKP